MPTQTEPFYAVQITSRASGKPCLAICNPMAHQAGPALFYFRAEALRLKNALRSEGFIHARVIKATATYRW